MAANWSVFLDVLLFRQVSNWGKPAQRDLFAVQELLRGEGPEAFELYADSFANGPSWDDLSEPCLLEFFVEVAGRSLLLELEIRPGRTIVFRRARRA